MSAVHASVLLGPAVDGLDPRDGGRYIDATCGLGGHSEALLEKCGPTGRVLAVDRDPAAIELAEGRLARFGDRVTVVEGDFSDLPIYAEASDFAPADGVIADLGVSSLQLDDPGRGFSFLRDGPLDMRMGPRVGATAAELLENFSVPDLERVLRDFGEERRAHRLAVAIVEARDAGALTSTAALAAVIERVLGGRKASPVHPATRAFQAIRIAVNRELEELERLLEVLPGLLAPGGRAAIISFHSLEDRLVKRAFEDPSPPPTPRGLPVEPVRVYGPWRALGKKPIVPDEAEIRNNPRARSAKLRVAERRPPSEEGQPR